MRVDAIAPAAGLLIPAPIVEAEPSVALLIASCVLLLFFLLRKRTKRLRRG